MEGAIAKKTESLYVKLNEGDQHKVQQIFLRLVRPGEGEADTRRRATFAEVGEGLRSLVKTLADERLLVTSQVAGSAEETIEVSHEALIRNWERLKQWVEADRRFLTWQLRLSAAVKEWEGSTRGSDLLLRGLPLMEAVGWFKRKPSDLSSVEREFVTASMNRKKRNRMAIATMAGLVLMVVGVTIWLWGIAASMPFSKSSRFLRVFICSPRCDKCPPEPFAKVISMALAAQMSNLYTMLRSDPSL